MKKLVIAALLGMASLAGRAGLAEDPSQASENTQTAEKSYLLVLTAASGELKEGKLVLRDASDLVGWFTDRPYRETGRFNLEHLPGVWSAGSDSLETDPPNAVLVASGLETDPTIVELTDLVVDGTTVSFSVVTLEGPEMSAEGAVTLIVDDIEICGIWNCNCNPQCPW